MKCGHCKDTDVTTDHVRKCSTPKPRVNHEALQALADQRPSRSVPNGPLGQSIPATYTDPMAVAAQYGARVFDVSSVEETAALRESVNHDIQVMWDDPELVKILRFRLIGCSWEYPFWDISYCYGELEDGTRVRVDLPEHQLPRNWKVALVELGKRDGVHVKSLGFFDAVSTLNG